MIADRKKEKQNFQINDILDMVQQLIFTFSELEGRGYVHRDLKAENILY